MIPPERNALGRTLICIGLALAVGAAAQEAVMPAPDTSMPAPRLRESGPATRSQPAPPTDSFFTYGPLSLHPHLMVRSMYGLRMQSRDGRKVASMIYTTSPGLRTDFGENWTLDYTPTWTRYTARALDDTLDHSARLSGAWVLRDWAVQFSEAYRKSSPLLLETGGQTPQRTWATGLGASRSFGSRLNLQLGVSLDERYGEDFPDTRDWATMNWLTWQLSPRFQTGFGLGAGYSDIVGEPDATHERYLARLRWSPTDKLSLDLDAGMEDRHSRASAAEDLRNPIFNAAVIYRPFDVTQISLSGSRTVTNSYFQNQVTESTGWNLGLQQRLLGKLYLNVSYGDRRTDFESTTPLLLPELPPETPGPGLISLPGRSDQVETVSLRLTVTLREFWTLAGTFQRTYQRSDQPGFDNTPTQFGVEVGCRF